MSDNENFLDLNTNNTYIIACTYGPDSMCLLDLVLSYNIKPIVCFVNYHYDELIEGEEESLKKYCDDKGLTLEILDTNKVDREGKDKDFSEWARKTRYKFFKEIYDKYNADALLIAHSQDDLLETYLTTKKLGKKFDKYGYAPYGIMNGMMVIRPLLSFSFEDILNHNQKFNVPFSNHASSFENQYTRSSIRQSIEQMNEIERSQILEQMNEEYIEKKTFTKDVSYKTKVSEELGIRELIALQFEDFAMVLTNFIKSKSPIKISLTPKKLKEIRQMLLDYNPVITYELKNNVFIVKEYDTISIEVDPYKLTYSYRLEKPSILKTNEFSLDFSNGATDRGIKDDDYPLTIRTMLPGDSYSYRGYKVPVRRVFLDEEMPREYRNIWPVFVNKDSKIVYVPRYHKIFKEYHTSTLLLNLPDIKK